MLQGLLDAQKRGELQGIIGRLGDLGAIDQRYDVAVSTACGALDNIVCRSTEDAQVCVVVFFACLLACLLMLFFVLCFF